MDKLSPGVLLVASREQEVDVFYRQIYGYDYTTVGILDEKGVVLARPFHFNGFGPLAVYSHIEEVLNDDLFLEIKYYPLRDDFGWETSYVKAFQEETEALSPYDPQEWFYEVMLSPAKVFDFKKLVFLEAGEEMFPLPTLPKGERSPINLFYKIYGDGCILGRGVTLKASSRPRLSRDNCLIREISFKPSPGPEWFLKCLRELKTLTSALMALEDVLRQPNLLIDTAELRTMIRKALPRHLRGTDTITSSQHFSEMTPGEFVCSRVDGLEDTRLSLREVEALKSQLVSYHSFLENTLNTFVIDK